MKILVFTEGTVLIHRSLSEIDDFANYIPNGQAVEKINAWKQQGAEIHYLTSRTDGPEIEAIQSVLIRNNFPDSKHLHARTGNQTYADVAETVMPDILIEDDCDSIGGEAEMTYPHIKHEFKSSIKSVVVKEFAGIDDLPTDLQALHHA
jgi:hypothetical protein